MAKLEGYRLNINVWLGKDDGSSISWNEASLNLHIHDLKNLLYYEHWKDKWKYIYI